MCQKIAYPNKEEAAKDAAYILTQRKRFTHRATGSPKAGRKLRPYECPKCEKWHLTTQKRRKDKR